MLQHLAKTCLVSLGLLMALGPAAHAQTFHVITFDEKPYDTPAATQASAPSAPDAVLAPSRVISVHVKSANFYALLTRMATRMDLTLTAQPSLNLQKDITIDLYAMPIEQAMRQIASAAGYRLKFELGQRNVQLVLP